MNPPNRYPLPRHTAEILADLKFKPQNPGLLFERLLPDISAVSAEEAKGIKGRELDKIVEASTKIDKPLLEECLKRWELAVQAAGGQPFSLKTEWRLVAGLGRKGQLEVGFTFHRYGFACLPGSSVKGVARGMALAELCEMWEDGPDLAGWDRLLNLEDEKKFTKEFDAKCPNAPGNIRQMAADFRAVFGSQDCAGLAIFFEALPDRAPELVVDIMNPHFSEYYQGKAAPTNWQKPVPVSFLTVAAPTAFRFAVGWRGPDDENGRRLHQLAEGWLRSGLTRLGAGAKTNAGYGFFSVPETMETATPPSQVPEPVKEVPLVTRRGKILRIDASRGGRLQDVKDSQEYAFTIPVIHGNFPGKGAMVTFKLKDGQVVFIEKA